MEIPLVTKKSEDSYQRHIHLSGLNSPKTREFDMFMMTNECILTSIDQIETRLVKT